MYADGWVNASSQWRKRQARRPKWGVGPTRACLEGFLRRARGGPPGLHGHISSLHKEFNAAVREAGRSRAHYLQHFSSKTLHFP